MVNSLPAGSVKTMAQGQIATVNSDLTMALSDFKAGGATNFQAGVDLVQQAMQLLHLIVTEIRA